jgi:CRISPR-associated endonuclease Csy4
MLSIDIQLRHDPDFPQQHLLNALYAKLHRALAADGKGTIGVSFPKHNASRPYLGPVLRLHGTNDDLAALLATPWLTGMRDHVDVGELRAVPRDAMHRVVRRVQAKSSVDRMRRRAMQRHSIDADEAARRIPDSAAESLALPHVMLPSKSTGQPVFPLFIEHGPLRSTPSSGRFNSYGLSTTATVPWFD